MAVSITPAARRSWFRRLCRGILCSALAFGASPGLHCLAQESLHSQWALTNTHVSLDNTTDGRQSMQMVVNTSREITASQVFKRVRIQNPNVLSAIPLEGGNRLQISAIATGVTQVDLLGADESVHTIEVMVLGDVRELEAVLRQQFPDSNLQVVPVQAGAIVSGFVTTDEHVNLAMSIAELYFPTVINNVSVTGVHTIQLETQIMEVSRTKLRELGIDWAFTNGDDFIRQTIKTGAETFSAGIIENGTSFTTSIRALQRENLVKVLASPTLTAVDGRPASFNSGGEFPIVIPAGLGQVGVQYREFGTRLDYVAKVRGGGRIWLEVRPYVSEIDPSRSVLINGTSVPGLRSRYLETAAELGAGQTLALAGLLQVRSETINSGLPILSNMPYLGALFRTTHEEQNEVELLITITPNFAGPMDPHEVPRSAPGTSTQSPTDTELYFRGYVETPVTGDYGADGACNDMGLIQDFAPSIQQMPSGMIQGQYPEGPSGQGGNGQTQLAPAPGMPPAIAPVSDPSAMKMNANNPSLAQRPTMVAQQNYYPQPASAVQPAGRQVPPSGMIMR
ncbi:MAG: pilus assembly protein N-terminal domain-containing protein [Aureliella sp.]